jgi:hypothetical protein
MQWHIGNYPTKKFQEFGGMRQDCNLPVHVASKRGIDCTHTAILQSGFGIGITPCDYGTTIEYEQYREIKNQEFRFC